MLYLHCYAQISPRCTYAPCNEFIFTAIGNYSKGWPAIEYGEACVNCFTRGAKKRATRASDGSFLNRSSHGKEHLSHEFRPYSTMSRFALLN